MKSNEIMQVKPDESKRDPTPPPNSYPTLVGLIGIYFCFSLWIPLGVFGPLLVPLCRLWIGLPLGAQLPLGILWDPFGRPGAYAVWVEFFEMT